MTTTNLATSSIETLEPTAWRDVLLASTRDAMRIVTMFGRRTGDAVAVAYQAWFAAHGSDATGALNAKQATRFQDMVGSLETCRSKAGGSDSLLP